MTHTKKLTSFFSLAFLSFSLFSCNGNKEVILSKASIFEDSKFKSAVVDISIDDFNALGFSFGDSCTVSFSNGQTLEDVPYYNGYYVKNGDPVIVGYPSSTNISITFNNIGIWDDLSLKNTDTVDIKLVEKKKYISTQEALSQSYSLDRNQYASDVEFVNFRSLTGGALKENYIFRGASPVDNSRNRAKYTDTLLKENNVKTIIDLADSDDDMNNYLAEDDFSSDYTKGLFEDKSIILLAMGSGYTRDDYKKSVVDGFKFMSKNSSPYYIHCMEGKDRTGFVCTLIEALAGATYDEMCADYMMTYKNYYKISKEETKDKYDAIVSLYFDSFIDCIVGSEDSGNKNLSSYEEGAKNYLRSGGMTDNEIDEFITLITK